MTRKVLEEIAVPAKTGAAVIVKAGQYLRIIDLEGQQVADVVFYNAHDYTEVYSAGHSVYMNMRLETGDSRMIKTLWSSPPNERVMLTVTDDPVKTHHIPLATCCSKSVYSSSPIYDGEIPRSCADNLTEALKAYDVPSHFPDVFNVFLNYSLEEWIAGNHVFKVPVSKPGDYLEFRAEIDVLVGVSACPSDKSPTNGFKATSIGIQILE